MVWGKQKHNARGHVICRVVDPNRSKRWQVKREKTTKIPSTIQTRAGYTSRDRVIEHPSYGQPWSQVASNHQFVPISELQCFTSPFWSREISPALICAAN